MHITLYETKYVHVSFGALYAEPTLADTATIGYVIDFASVKPLSPFLPAYNIPRRTQKWADFAVLAETIQTLHGRD